MAASFHTFSIVALVFIPAVLFINSKKKLIVFCIVLAFSIITTLEIVHVIVLRYFTHFDYYFRNNFHSEQHFGVTSFAYVTIELLVLFVMLKNYKMEEDNRYQIVIYSIGLVCAAFALIMMPRFGIYERIAKFFQPILVLAIPFALEGIKVRDNKRIVEIGIMSFSIMYYIYIIITNAYLIVPFQFWKGKI